MSIHAAIRARHPDRTADVAADFERRQTRRQRRAAATGAAARRARQIPRIVRASVDRAVGLPVAERDRNVRFAEQARAGREHRARERSVARGPIVLERGDACGLRQTRRFASIPSASSADRAAARAGRARARRPPARAASRARSAVRIGIEFNAPSRSSMRCRCISTSSTRRHLARAKRRQHFGCCAVGANRLRHALHSSAWSLERSKRTRQSAFD